jgi:L-threonylcarbamoyladenylate synthase
MHLKFQVRQAAETLCLGGVVAYPTEAMYGFGCLPGEGTAADAIFELKQRSPAAGVILIAADIDQIFPWANPDQEELKNLCRKTKTPTTWVVSARSDTPLWLTGGRNTIALRITRHPLAAALCEAADSALVSTSANRSGHPPARSAIAVRYRFGKELDFVLAGAIGAARRPSEIRSARSGDILRKG